MTAEEFLSRLSKIQRKIRVKQREAETWRSIATQMSQQMDGNRVQSSSEQDKMATAVAKAVDYEREAQALTWQLLNLQFQIIAMLDKMPTDDYGILLSDHYVNGMTLMQIADEWGFSYRHIKRLKAAAVAEFSDLYQNSSLNVTLCHLESP